MKDSMTATPTPAPDLGPLPEPVDELCVYDGLNVLGTQPVFTADQMRAERQRTYAAGVAAGVPAGHIAVPRWVLERASESLGSFVSDHGWAQVDMDAMDNIDAYLARSPTPPAEPAEPHSQRPQRMRRERHNVELT